jgi:alcohol dehydrogenase class IV
LQEALGVNQADEGLASLLRSLPIPQRLREVGFDQGKIGFVANEIAAMAVKVPRPATAEDVQSVLTAAY